MAVLRLLITSSQTDGQGAMGQSPAVPRDGAPRPILHSPQLQGHRETGHGGPEGAEGGGDTAVQGKGATGHVWAREEGLSGPELCYGGEGRVAPGVQWDVSNTHYIYI